MGNTTNYLRLFIIVQTHTIVVNNHLNNPAIDVRNTKSQPVFSIDPDSTWTEDPIKKK